MTQELELHDWVMVTLLLLVCILFWLRNKEYHKKSLEYKNQKELLDKWFNSSSDLHCTLSAGGMFTFLSKGWAKTTGYSLEELKSKPYIDFVHPQDRKKTIAEASALQDTNHYTTRFVNRHIRKDKTELYLEWTAASDGIQIYATAKDISEYHKKDIDLKHWLLVGLELVATTKLTDPEKWSFVSKGLQQLLGRTEAELTSRPWREWIEFEEEFEEEFDNFTIITKAKTKTKTINGSKIHLLWNITQDRHSGSMYMSATNMTEFIKQQEHLKSIIHELEQANMALSGFANVAAHQLRSPPRSILGAAQIIEEDFEIPEGMHEYIRDIKQDAILLSDIVDGLHKVSDIRKLKGLKALPVDLNTILRPIRITYCREVPDCHIKINPDLPVVLGDQTLLTEAFSNLIDNGLKFNKSIVKMVKVYVIPDPQNFAPTIIVEDNGVGIDPTYHKKLFLLFERLTTEFPGTGVGLYLTKMIIERLGGTIRLESEVDRGTKFFISLPTHKKESSV